MAKKKTDKRKRWLLWLLIILALALIGLFIYQKNKKPKGEEVELDKVERRTIKEKVSASGRIYPKS